jgi:hypothetical protein
LDLKANSSDCLIAVIMRGSRRRCICLHFPPHKKFIPFFEQQKFIPLIMEQLFFFFRPCFVFWNLGKTGGYLHRPHEAMHKIQRGPENTIGDGKQNGFSSSA